MNSKLSRSQKELHAKLLGTKIERFVSSTHILSNQSFHEMSSKRMQERTVDKFLELGYLKELRREHMNGSVEKITYEVIEPNPIKRELGPDLHKPIQHSKLRKAEVMEILQGGGFFEEVEGLRTTVKYYMGQHRLNSGWVNEWRESGLIESYEREYYNGTFRGCKWRFVKGS